MEGCAWDPRGSDTEGMDSGSNDSLDGILAEGGECREEHQSPKSRPHCKEYRGA